MKRWTVLLVPQGRGTTRTLHLSSLYLWTLVFLLASLGFCSTFFFQRYRLASSEADALVRAYHHYSESLPIPSAPGEPAVAERSTDEERAEIDRQVREEYETREQAILAELSQLYDVEKKFREINKLRPRTKTFTGGVVGKGDVGGGKGGPPGDLRDTMAGADEDVPPPPQVIYGLFRPSADLIVQEINLRKRSLLDYLDAVRDKAMQDKSARTPSIWPVLSPRREISSGFGRRIDPFSRTIRGHDGVDISAPRGSTVVATAAGVVTSAAYESYFGNLVKIDHGGGIVTWYGHLDQITVRRGARVERGDMIGKLGNTGRTTGPHVHYEVHVNGKPVNGERYLGN